MPAVLIYRSTLLASSEPWVVTQSEAVPGYPAHYLGHAADPASWVPPERTTISSWGVRPLRLAAFLVGRDPAADRCIESVRPALVHAHFGPDGMFAAATARRHRLPLVVSFHGYDATRPDTAFTTPGGRLWLRRRQGVFHQAALLLANSTYVRDHLVERGAPAQKVCVHHLGIDTAAFTPPIDGARRPGNVLFVGRLVEAKGIDVLVRAMADVRRAMPGATLTVIGDGPMRASVEQLSRELGVDAEFVGAQPQQAVREAMQRASLLCGPSTVSAAGQREAFGLVFAEAQACGLPVVTCRSGGIPDVVVDGVGGLLADEGDQTGIAAAITTLLGDDDLRHTFGVRGREHVLEHFDLARRSAALAAHYDAVVGA